MLTKQVDDNHDLFNALVWLTFPNIKSALNARHYHALIAERKSGNNRRGAMRDVNTPLDESGVIVAWSDEELAGLLREFRWKELFWQNREQIRKRLGFYLFGHGLYVKALHPYAGMTGQGLLVRVQQDFFSWPYAQQLKHLDSQSAGYLAMPEHCQTTRELSPVPLLGVPGWTSDNDSASYYDNTAYFRPGRRA